MPGKIKGALLAEGAYTYHRGETSTGRETWQLTKLAHGGLVLSSRIERTAPTASITDLTFEATPNWTPVRFSARLDTEGKTLTTEQRAAGPQWQARIEPRGEAAQELTLDFGAKHEIGFASPVVFTATLFRLNLQVGQSLEVDTIMIDPATLTPRAIKQAYACTAEEKIQVPAGEFAAWHYTQSENQFWADRHGVVLLYQTAAGEAMKLARYRRIERR